VKKLLLFILIALASFSFAAEVMIYDDTLVWKSPRYNRLTINISVTDTNFIYPENTTNNTVHYYPITVKNERGGNVNFIPSNFHSSVNLSGITFYNVTGYSTGSEIWTYPKFNESNNETYVLNVSRNYSIYNITPTSTLSIPRRSTVRFMMSVDTSTWAEGAFNFTALDVPIDPFVSACGTLTAANTTYTLINNINTNAGGACIIMGNQLQSFDLNRYTIKHGNSTVANTIGVYSTNKNNKITTSDASVRGAIQDFVYDVYINGTSYNLVEKITLNSFVGKPTSLYIINSTSTKISSLKINSNWTGMYSYLSTGTAASSTTCTANSTCYYFANSTTGSLTLCSGFAGVGGTGIFINTANKIEVVGGTFTSSTGGACLISSGANNTFKSGVLCKATDNGVALQTTGAISINNTFRDGTAQNTLNGAACSMRSTDNRFLNWTCSSNSSSAYGDTVLGGSRNNYTNGTITSIAGTCVDLRGVSQNNTISGTFINCTASTGVLFTFGNSKWNTLYNNTFSTTTKVSVNNSNSQPQYFNTTSGGICWGNWYNWFNSSIDCIDVDGDRRCDVGKKRPFNSTNTPDKFAGAELGDFCPMPAPNYAPTNVTITSPSDNTFNYSLSTCPVAWSFSLFGRTFTRCNITINGVNYTGTQVNSTACSYDMNRSGDASNLTAWVTGQDYYTNQSNFSTTINYTCLIPPYPQNCSFIGNSPPSNNSQTFSSSYDFKWSCDLNGNFSYCQLNVSGALINGTPSFNNWNATYCNATYSPPTRPVTISIQGVMANNYSSIGGFPQNVTPLWSFYYATRPLIREIERAMPEVQEAALWLPAIMGISTLIILARRRKKKHEQTNPNLRE
jgi:hypothetical protein